ncbi:DUF1345 domain-containing protein [Crenobacter intestini]|uniref:DUF1345 domain-containing protein n=1 Tax=Crenobacter intestini TaxID=2563443 RepID=A0A4T0V5R6_9NEIS|nr:DUF1345 domain-containing protein [Crenobacter intestini]TIC86939.1 DUF1345 domain-containing protein [Crenobacter intestini]
MRKASFSQRVRALVGTRPRLTFALALGAAAWFLLPADSPLLLRALLAWNVTAWTYLIGLWLVVFSARPHHIRRHAVREDESAALVLALVCTGSLMSVAAIVIELAMASHGAWHVALTVVTLTSAWLLLPTCFAVHYAHLFYLADPAKPILQFPDEPAEPDYWDFLYFSFTIAATNQTADVGIASARVRRLVLLQGMLSFVFNLFILGLTVNLAAGLLGG